MGVWTKIGAAKVKITGNNYFWLIMTKIKTFLAPSTPKKFTSILDSKIQAALATDTTIMEATPIFSNNTAEDTLLSWLKNIF